MAGLISTAASAQPMMQSPAPEPPEPSTAAATTADPSATDPNKVICRSVRPPTGTRVRSARTRQKVCMSKADWDQQEREAQEQLRERDRGVCPMNGTCKG